MNIASDEIEEMRKNILTLIRELTVELSSENESTILFRSSFLAVLAEEEKILLQDRLDLDRLKIDNFGIFRTVTDDDFRLTPLGQKFYDLCIMMDKFIKKSTMI